MSPSPFSNEIFAMFIESLGEDLRSLRACSLVSSVFRHFCSPILYRDIALDRKEKVDDFIQVGERSDSLQHIKSLSLRVRDQGASTQTPYNPRHYFTKCVAGDPHSSPDPVSGGTSHSIVTLQTQHSDGIGPTGLSLWRIPGFCVLHSVFSSLRSFAPS